MSRWSIDPAVTVLLLTAVALYAHACVRLARRGMKIGPWQRSAFYGGITLVAVALMSPIDGYSEDLFVAHMGQHLIIADLAAPLMLAGLRWPVHVFFLPRPLLVPLARRHRLRRVLALLSRPLVAIPVYVLVLYAWHLGFMFEGAQRNELVHGLQHQSFIVISLLVWWPALEPNLRRPRGELWKIGHILAARVGGMFLGMAFIAMRSPAYDVYGERARQYGLTPLEDQQLGGALMLSLDFFIVLFALSFFFWRAALDEDLNNQQRT